MVPRAAGAGDSLREPKLLPSTEIGTLGAETFDISNIAP
jgi:hypothetical protein